MIEATGPAYADQRPLAAELALAGACCRWPPSRAADRCIVAAAASVQNWRQFDAIVRRNRVNPLAHHALRRTGVDLPDCLAESLATRARTAAGRSLVLARESLQLQRAFAEAGIPSMIIKGTPLALIAYGELGLKESVDVDLLVPPEHALRARDLLIGRGGRMTPPMSDRAFHMFVEHDKEAVFLFDEPKLTVELHWRLVRHRALLRGVDAHGPEQFVEVPGGTIRTLADEPLFAFLCLHGALHNWSRLKWLADTGAFLAARSSEHIAQLHDAAHGLGAGRSSAVAMLLCRRLFGTPIAPELLESVRKDPVAGALVENVMAGLSYRRGGAEHKSHSAPWLRMRAAQFLVAPGAAHLIDHVRVVWTSPTDRAQIALPRRLGFVHHLLRIPLWLGRACRRVLWPRRS